jgi:hypothetical protein
MFGEGDAVQHAAGEESERCAHDNLNAVPQAASVASRRDHQRLRLCAVEGAIAADAEVGVAIVPSRTNPTPGRCRKPTPSAAPWPTSSTR